MTTSHRVLCIEDDAEIADLLDEVLTDAGFEVQIAHDGSCGLEKIKYKPDIVICDVEMPGMSGFDVLKHIRRSDSSESNLPFLFLTAYGMRENQIKAFRLGCDDYITKPIDFEILIEIINRQLQRRLTPASSAPGFQLTDREVQVMTLVARGKSSTDIAALTKVSERTVNFHVVNIMRKAGVTSRAQAAAVCTKLGLICP